MKPQFSPEMRRVQFSPLKGGTFLIEIFKFVENCLKHLREIWKCPCWGLMHGDPLDSVCSDFVPNPVHYWKSSIMCSDFVPNPVHYWKSSIMCDLVKLIKWNTQKAQLDPHLAILINFNPAFPWGSSYPNPWPITTLLVIVICYSLVISIIFWFWKRIIATPNSDSSSM